MMMTRKFSTHYLFLLNDRHVNEHFTNYQQGPIPSLKTVGLFSKLQFNQTWNNLKSSAFLHHSYKTSLHKSTTHLREN